MTFTDKNVRINSPTSKRAIFILGIDEDTLYEITKEEYLEKNEELKDAPNVLKNKRYEEFNFRRLKMIDDARKLRNDIKKYGTIWIKTPRKPEEKWWREEQVFYWYLL